MNKKYIIIGIVLLVMVFFLPVIVTSETTFDNEKITNIRAIQKELYEMDDVGNNDTKIPYQIDVNYYINITGNPTSTFTIQKIRAIVDTEFNINSLNNVNKSIKNSIKIYAKERWNYTMSDSKILIFALTKGSDVS